MMKKMLTLSTLVLMMLVAMLLVACGGAVESPASSEELNFESLLAALEAAGLDVQAAGEADEDLLDPLFEGTPYLLEVAGQQIQVYEFESVEAAEEATGTVMAGGTIIGNKTVDWVEPPHYYQADRLIVLYAGTSEEILGALQAALGEPFVVGTGGFLPPADDSGDE